jgi:DnaJ family protein A protein 3
MPVGKKEVFITFRVQKSPVFRRDGADIHSDVLISVAQAVLGGTARAQGLYETVNLSVRDTQTDQPFCDTPTYISDGSMASN